MIQALSVRGYLLKLPSHFHPDTLLIHVLILRGIYQIVKGVLLGLLLTALRDRQNTKVISP